MSWLREAISDSRTGRASAKRVSVLMAGASMSLAIIVLAVAACFGAEVAASLTALAVPLAGMAGYGYVQGKRAEGERDGIATGVSKN